MTRRTLAANGLGNWRTEKEESYQFYGKLVEEGGGGGIQTSSCVYIIYISVALVLRH